MCIFDISYRNGSFFDISQLHFQTTFAEKKQTRAYTFDDLVGACGGYIGLFLGYNLVQLCGVIEFLFHAIKRKTHNMKNQQNIPKPNHKEDV